MSNQNTSLPHKLLNFVTSAFSSSNTNPEATSNNIQPVVQEPAQVKAKAKRLPLEEYGITEFLQKRSQKDLRLYQIVSSRRKQKELSEKIQNENTEKPKAKREKLTEEKLKDLFLGNKVSENKKGKEPEVNKQELLQRYKFIKYYSYLYRATFYLANKMNPEFLKDINNLVRFNQDLSSAYNDNNRNIEHMRLHKKAVKAVITGEIDFGNKVNVMAALNYLPAPQATEQYLDKNYNPDKFEANLLNLIKALHEKHISPKKERLCETKEAFFAAHHYGDRRLADFLLWQYTKHRRKVKFSNKQNLFFTTNKEKHPIHAITHGYTYAAKKMLVLPEVQKILETRRKEGKSSFLFDAVQEGLLEIVKELIKWGEDPYQQGKKPKKQDPTQSGPEYDLTPLMYAVVHNHAHIVDYLLKNYNKNINDATKETGRTALYYAAGWENTKVLDTLLRLNKKHNLGLDLEKRSNIGWTPLMIALMREQMVNFDLLVEYGANIKALTREGDNMFIFLCKCRQFHFAVKSSIKHLLEKYSFDINSQNTKGETALIATLAEEEFFDSRVRYMGVKTLLEEGADLNKQNNEGKTALYILAEREWTSKYEKEAGVGYTEMLLEKKPDINIAAKDGKTPFIIAAKNGHKDILEAILKHVQENKINFNIDEGDYDGMNAVLYAMKYEHWKIVNYLSEQGAGLPKMTLKELLPYLAGKTTMNKAIEHKKVEAKNPKIEIEIKQKPICIEKKKEEEENSMDAVD